MQTEVNRYVVCLKYGDKYSAEYVNKLYNMVQRHLSLDHEFYCITENSAGLDPNIKLLPLDINPDIDIGWWYKINLFDPKFPLKGTILFLDLDIVIFNSIDKFSDFYQIPGLLILHFRFHFRKIGIQVISCFERLIPIHTAIYQNGKTAPISFRHVGLLQFIDGKFQIFIHRQ